MANIWLISDTHFDHYNIIKYCDRPFDTVKQMNDCIITGINERVKPGDHLWHLGDVCLIRPKYMSFDTSILHGHKRLIRGNHDIFKTAEYIAAGWQEIYGSRVLDNMIFTHIPIHPSSLGRFAANIHGHTHTQPNYPAVKRFDGKGSVVPYINLCVEQTNYLPVAFEDVKQMVRTAGGSFK